jgi:YbbR domain-containing protein
MHLFENLPLKVVSLVLAILLWFVIAGEKSSEMGLSVPLELQNFPKDLELTGDPVNAVEVRLRASPGIMQRLSPGDVSAQLDLRGAGEGERIVHLTADSIRVPFGVKVVKMSPAIITLNLERTVQKVVPIRPRLLGKPARGYEVGRFESDPAQIGMAGPKSRVDEVESAFTEPVSVEGAESNVVATVNIGLEDPLLRIQGSPRVKVVAEVRALHERRIIEAVTIAVRGGVASVSPSVVRVILTGPALVLRSLAAGAVHAYVDVSHLEGTGKLPVAIELGGTGVSLERAEPAEVVVERKED